MNAPDPPTDRRRLQLWWRVSGVVTVLAMIALGIRTAFAIRDAREASRRSQCKGNLKQLALAFHNYHEIYGAFPPAYVADENGKPMHSWRVLILPFIDQLGVYERYDFSQSWNSPKNLELGSLARIMFVQCPSEHLDDGSLFANYVVVTGPDTLFPFEGTTSLDQITDGPGNTMLIVEIADSDIHWMEPRDLRIDEMSFAINDPNRLSPSSQHRLGAQAAFVDGSVYFLRSSANPLAIRAAATIAGGESYNAGDLVAPASPP